MELIEFFFGLIIMVIAGFFAWESSVMISEKKARYRAGTHDYYDNPIKTEKE